VRAEITLFVAGTDDVALHAVHARRTWSASAIGWGARLADVLSETPEGHLLDLSRFDELEPTLPTASLRYTGGRRGDRAAA
jgi:hypothetical protein